MEIYMGVLILGAILQYTVSAYFSCFLWVNSIHPIGNSLKEAETMN